MATRGILTALAIAILTWGGFACSEKVKEKPSPAPSALLEGSIDLAPELNKDADPLAVIFVIAKSPEGQIVAVKKLLPPFQYPVAFSLGGDDVMIPGTEPKGPLELTARLDKDGNANPAQPGDILGKAEPAEVTVGAKNVKIVLGELVK